MLEWVLSFFIVLAGFFALGMVMQFIRRQGRRAAVTDDGQNILKEAVDVSVQLVVDAKVPGGLRPGTSYRSQGHLRLTEAGLLLATNHGRVLEMTEQNTGTVRAPGPRMMILEGPHPSGRARVRAELVVSDEAGWKNAIEQRALTA